MKRSTTTRTPFSSVLLATLIIFGLSFPVNGADAPPQFGNFLSSGQFSYFWPGSETGSANYPIYGRVNMADHNSPIPTDRIFGHYTHFRNSSIAAVSPTSNLDNPTDRSITSLEQYTLGVEKTFLDGGCSVELRMPFFSQTDSFVSDQSNSLNTDRGAIGNLTVFNKFQLCNSPTFALTAALGVSLPTGHDAEFVFPFGTATLKNRAVHLQPFLGFVSTPTERSFFQGSGQFDLPLNDNRIELTNSLIPLTNRPVANQKVLFLDVSAGYWLYRFDKAPWFTGLASIVELHYTTALEDAQTTSNGAGPNQAGFRFENTRNRFDMLNLTLGIQSEFRSGTQVRVAGVIPLRGGDDQFFDSEIQISIIREF